MIVEVRTELDCSADEAFARVLAPATLAYIAKPVLTFAPEAGNALPERWEEGATVRLRLYGLGIVPLGRHVIKLTRVDRAGRRLETEETGGLARVWNHEIEATELPGGRCAYRDRIEIEAAILTLCVAATARVFFWHRQRRLRRLARSGG